MNSYESQFLSFRVMYSSLSYFSKTSFGFLGILLKQIKCFCYIWKFFESNVH